MILGLVLTVNIKYVNVFYGCVSIKVYIFVITITFVFISNFIDYLSCSSSSFEAEFNVQSSYIDFKIPWFYIYSLPLQKTFFKIYNFLFHVLSLFPLLSLLLRLIEYSDLLNASLGPLETFGIKFCGTVATMEQ